MSNDKNVRARAVCAMGVLAVVAMSAQAADYTWLANPVSANWLTDLNWDQGAWDETATANKALFGASSQTAVDVNGDVTAASVAVDGADYTFGGAGTLAVNGPFDVAAGRTVTVNGPLAQTGPLANRLVKDGDGTLVVRGDSTLGHFAVHGGTVKFDGGTHSVTGKTTDAGEAAIALSLGKGALVIEGGAVFKAVGGATYAANSGVDVYVTNGVFDVWDVSSQFLNAFMDNNKALVSRKAALTVRDAGEVVAKTFRIAKANSNTYYPDNAGDVNLGPGGRFVFRNFFMDEGVGKRYYGTMNFDGGTLVTTNTANDKANGYKLNRFSTGDRQANGSWQNVHLYVKEGGLTIDTQGDCDSYFYKAFESGAEHDGGLTLTGKHCAYLYATNSYNGGTTVTGGVYCAVDSDRSLGAVPAEPTDNVFVRSSSAFFHFGGTCDIHPNRTFRLADGVDAQFGTYGGGVGRIRGQVLGEKATLKVVSNWSGTVALAPEEGFTNRIGKLQVYGVLRIDGGTTLAVSNCAGNIGVNCPLLVRGNGSSFSETRGCLVVAGGTLKVVEENCYMQVGDYGQVIVTNGVLVVPRELLSGISGGGVNNWCGRTTVADGGEIVCGQLRISQGTTMKDGLPVNEVNVRTGGVVRLNNFYIDTGTNQRGLLNLDGGVAVPRKDTENFLGTGHGKWLTNIIVRACAGGAIFDTTNFNISVKNPVFSGAEQDGGLTKRGAGTLTMVNTNTYNGVTRLEGGTLAFTHAEGYPGGDIEIAAAAVQGKTLAAPLLTAQAVTFREGKGVRVTEADTLNDKTFGRMKTVATFTTPLAALPSLTLVNTDGTEWTSSKQWCLQLADGGKTLQFGALSGTQVILR